WIRGLFTRIGMLPFRARDALGRMGSVLEDVVDLVGLALFDFGDLLANKNHRLAETIELGLRFALGWRDHHRAWNRQRDRRSVEAVVHQSLGDVLDLDARGRLELAQIDDALMGHKAMAALVENREMRLEALGDVIGAENRELRGALEAFTAHHRDVHPRDGK